MCVQEEITQGVVSLSVEMCIRDREYGVPLGTSSVS